MTADPVLERLEALAQDAGDDGLDDLGDQLLPDLVDDGLARSWALDGYWRDVGTVQAYWQAHQEFLEETPPLRLDDPQWPVHTRAGSEAAAWLARGAEVENSLVCGGARVAGSVAGSVLSPGVVIEAGAQVVDAVLLPGAVVRKGAVVAPGHPRRRRRGRPRCAGRRRVRGRGRARRAGRRAVRGHRGGPRRSPARGRLRGEMPDRCHRDVEQLGRVDHRSARPGRLPEPHRPHRAAHR